jgi:hypothetical protein
MTDLELQQRCLKYFDYKLGKLYWKVAQRGIRVGDEAGCVDDKGYRKVQVDEKKYYAHRLIFLMAHGYLPIFIDHIDQNRLNNKIANLREVTSRENSRNSKKRIDNASGIAGVSFIKARGKWEVRAVRENPGEKKHLGYFSHIFEAAAARISHINKIPSYTERHGR